ncbi:MAG TPA: hypothetical protein VF553_23360 [Pyrinomonadaceae bacterium]|jgi:hypothetical protein
MSLKQRLSLLSETFRKGCQWPVKLRLKTKRDGCALAVLLLIALHVSYGPASFACSQKCGPDAYAPVVFYDKRRRPIKKRARKPFEALALYRFDIPSPFTPGAGARKFDEFGGINFCDVFARLDNFAIQLQNEPNARGYIIVRGERGKRNRSYEKQAYASASKNYLVNTRGIDANRVSTVDGGEGDTLSVELWIVDASRSTSLGGYRVEVILAAR